MDSILQYPIVLLIKSQYQYPQAIKNFVPTVSETEVLFHFTPTRSVYDTLPTICYDRVEVENVIW